MEPSEFVKSKINPILGSCFHEGVGRARFVGNNELLTPSIDFLRNRTEEMVRVIVGLARSMRDLKGSRNFPGENPSPEYDRGVEDCVLAMEEELGVSDPQGVEVSRIEAKPPLQGVALPSSAYTFRTMALREVRDYTQHLTGRIKTIVDAAISDPQQNKAVKDLVHAAMWTEHYDAVREWAEVATVRLTPTNEPSQCIPAFPFATDHSVPASV